MYDQKEYNRIRYILDETLSSPILTFELCKEDWRFQKSGKMAKQMNKAMAMFQRSWASKIKVGNALNL